MGYPQFNKVTIQLPLPDSTMTKAEYKDAYGIDLDSIDFPKITLIVDGKNKYPVDEIKIVSDDVLIFAGGKILTIGEDGNVSVTSNAYSVENSKPIYCHPISMVDTVVRKRLTCLIFNNSETPFTLDTFKVFLDNLDTATSGNGRVMVSGAIYDDGETLIASYLLHKNNDYTISGLKASDGTAWNFSRADFNTLFPATTEFYDGVNKIN